MVIPDLLRNHRPGDDLTRMSHEVFQERIFFGREFDLCLIPKDPMTSSSKVRFLTCNVEDGATIVPLLRRARILARSSLKAKGLPK